MFYCRAGDEFVDLFGQFPVVHGVGKVVASGGVARIDVDRDVDDELLPVEALSFEYAVVTVTADSGQCDRVVMVQFAHLISRSEEHTSELQSRGHLVCRLLLEKKKKLIKTHKS